MKKSFKRVTSMVLTLAMLFSFIPSSLALNDAYDVNEDTNSEGVVSSQPLDSAENNDGNTAINDGSSLSETPEQDDGNNDIELHENADANSLANRTTYYVANSAAGGSDTSGDGSETNPYMTIGKAIASTPADADEMDIVLKSDIERQIGR